MKRKQFDGGLGKPIQFCVTILAFKNGDTWEGTAAWQYLNGSCKMSLAIDGEDHFSHGDLEARDKRDPTIAQAMQRQGLQPDEIAYLEACFRETIAESDPDPA